jgi:hypothetical protein
VRFGSNNLFDRLFFPVKRRCDRGVWTFRVVDNIGGDEGDRTPDLMNAILELVLWRVWGGLGEY